MGRVNLEERFFSELRLHKLASRLGGDLKTAIGCMALLWHESQLRGRTDGSKEEILDWTWDPDCKIFGHLVASGYLKKEQGDCFLIKGNDQQLSGLSEWRASKSAGGKARIKKAKRGSNGRFVGKPTVPTVEASVINNDSETVQHGPPTVQHNSMLDQHGQHDSSSMTSATSTIQLIPLQNKTIQPPVTPGGSGGEAVLTEPAQGLNEKEDINSEPSNINVSAIEAEIIPMEPDGSRSPVVLKKTKRKRNLSKATDRDWALAKKWISWSFEIVPNGLFKLEAYVDEIRKTRESIKFTEDEMEILFEWIRQDDFWGGQGNAISPCGIRKKSKTNEMRKIDNILKRFMGDYKKHKHRQQAVSEAMSEDYKPF